MNTSMIRVILSRVLIILGTFMVTPCIISLIYGEQEGLTYFLVASGCVLIGILLGIKKPKSQMIYLKDGLAATGLSWIIMTIAGALPFYITGEIPSFIDCLFETASGFSTTGSSILTDVEALSHTAIFWRSLTHFLGGMGVLVFLLAIIPSSGGSSINLMKAESPGPSVGKVVPKISKTAQMLYIIYSILTVLQFILLVAGQMPVFDAICTAFGTAGTGGFGIKNDSFASYTVYQQMVTAVFMYLFSINFNFYCFLAMKQFKKALGIEEVVVFCLLVILSVTTITINILPQTEGVADSFEKAFFAVGTVISTTGFATADFDTWPTLSKFILFTLMFVGACAGSTGGGIKVSRLLIAGKNVRRYIKSYFRPNEVRVVKMDGAGVDEDTIRQVNTYLVTYAAVYFISVFFISLENFDLVTTFSSVAATLNNIGPGLSLVGPSGNFSFFSPLSKTIFIFDMLLGRLELFPLLIFLAPDFYKAAIASKRPSRKF